CVVFIDEIDALGQRRSGQGGGAMGGMMGMMGGGQLGLNMLLVLMDGIDNPGFFVRQGRGLINLTLDGLFIPRVIGANGSKVSLRIPALKAPAYNIMFIGATNRPSVMDEALTRPGRFGRQIVFRLPNREDRKDIAALYFDKKQHDPALDTASRRDEFARITEQYSPADIEQVLSLALLYAFNDGRDQLTWSDIREAMGNVEAGLAIPVEYTERDRVAVARHELGHAVASHFFKTDHAHVRLSIRRRATTHGVVAQLLGAAYIDDWRLMNVNKDAIDQAAEALIVQVELVGDEISGLLDSVGLREPTAADPYPPDLPAIPDVRPAIAQSEQTA